MPKQSVGEKLTEDKLVKAAEFEANKDKPKKRGRKKTMSSDELCDTIPIRVNRRSTIKGYRGTNIFVPATQQGIHHSNLVMAELMKQCITAYMENLIGFGVGRSKPKDMLDLAHAMKIACELSANSSGWGKDKLPDMPDNQKSIFSKFFKAVGDAAKIGEHEMEDAEFEAKLQKVEEANEAIEDANDEFVDAELEWRSRNVKDMSDVYYEEVGMEGIEDTTEDTEQGISPEERAGVAQEIKKAQKEYFDEEIEKGAVAQIPRECQVEEDDADAGSTS
jgi:hypothetical protein